MHNPIKIRSTITQLLILKKLQMINKMIQLFLIFTLYLHHILHSEFHNLYVIKMNNFILLIFTLG